jgi:hypothetical protein
VSATLARQSELKRYGTAPQEDELEVCSEHTNKLPKQLSNGIWVGEGMSSAGERLYLGMEEVKPRGLAIMRR